MALWKYAAAVLTALPAGAHAQEGVDWGGIMMADAQGRAMSAEARRVAGNPLAKGPAAKRDDLQASRNRANCAKLQEQYDRGARPPDAPRLLALCKSYGYL